jgi:hypothetical protein
MSYIFVMPTTLATANCDFHALPETFIGRKELARHPSPRQDSRGPKAVEMPLLHRSLALVIVS